MQLKRRNNPKAVELFQHPKSAMSRQAAAASQSPSPLVVHDHVGVGFNRLHHGFNLAAIARVAGPALG